MKRRMFWARLHDPQTQLALGVMGTCYLLTLVLALLDEDVPLPVPEWRAVEP